MAEPTTKIEVSDQQWSDQDIECREKRQLGQDNPAQDDLEEGRQLADQQRLDPEPAGQKPQRQGAGHHQQVAPDHQKRNPRRQMGVER